jgi:hypothetical protein
MINLYRPKQPGDILRLQVLIGDVEPDTYVLLSVGDTCCLALLGENEEGQLCATSTLVDVSLVNLSLFVETGLHVEPV